jgi:hypothetical protein
MDEIHPYYPKKVDNINLLFSRHLPKFARYYGMNYIYSLWATIFVIQQETHA